MVPTRNALLVFGGVFFAALVFGVIGSGGISFVSTDTTETKDNTGILLDLPLETDGAEASTDTYVVTQVIDGDTIEVTDGTVTERVRLIGIDTPELRDERELVRCFAGAAKAETSRLLTDRSVHLELDPSQGTRDRYGRMLAYVYRDDALFVNKHLIAQGFAFEYTYDLPYRYLTEFEKAQHEAQAASRGMWRQEEGCSE